MKILIINSGSSSVKFQLIDTVDHHALAKGVISKIGMPGALLNMKVPGREDIKISGEILDHKIAIENILSILVDEEFGVLKDVEEINGIGHRVVHGGEFFSESVLITPEVINSIRHCIDYAPLHNPHNLRGINACKAALPDVPMVAVFDTAFHQGMPAEAYIYGIPYVLYKRHGIRRYGFHGTSHFFVSQRVSKIMEKDIKDMNIITCHLGNGCSISAIKNGVSVDTSMGFTPLEGLLMGTRSGDLDPAIITQVMAREELTTAEAATMMNKHSGLMGISGSSSDMKDIEDEMEDGNKRAKLAFDVFCYRLKKYIGSYCAVLGRVDALVFTGGIGENSDLVREESVKGLEFFGISVSHKLNKGVRGVEKEITGKDSITGVFIIPTNEELVIAIDTEKLITKNDN